MTCLWGQSRLWEFRAIAPRRRAEACGSQWKMRKQVWEAVEDSEKQVEGLEDVRKQVEDQEGPEEVRKAVGESGRGGKIWESNGMLQVPIKNSPT